jgi:predicted O-methyltransferase YrrM
LPGPPRLRLHPDKLDSGYAPSYEIPGNDLGDFHRSVGEAVRDIPGWLHEEDTRKLYELAFFSPGPILEIGTWCGKSAAVLAYGARDGGRNAPIFSVDVNESRLDQARIELSQRGFAASVTLVHGTVKAFLNAVAGFEPRLVFVDGNHSLRGVLRDLAALESRVPQGALLLFHDFSGARNDDPHDRGYEVARAVARSWVQRDCDFGGVFGLSGLFVRRNGPAPSAPARPLLLDAVRYDVPMLRIKQRIPPQLRERAHHFYRRFGRRLSSR